jgi:hypothetical protein
MVVTSKLVVSRQSSVGSESVLGSNCFSFRLPTTDYRPARSPR